MKQKTASDIQTDFCIRPLTALRAIQGTTPILRIYIVPAPLESAESYVMRNVYTVNLHQHREPLPIPKM